MKWTGISSCAIRRSVSRCGFSLTEITIVIGIIGIILGSIWVFADQAWENNRQAQLTNEILTVVKNVRAYYGGQRGIQGNFTTVSPKLIGLNLIPGDITRTGGTCTNVWAGTAYCADNPWVSIAATGSFGGCGWISGLNTNCNPGGPPPAITQLFGIEIQGIPQNACVKAAVLNSGSQAPAGFYDVVINGTSMRALGLMPPPVATAQANCNGLANTIDFVFTLVAPSS